MRSACARSPHKCARGAKKLISERTNSLVTSATVTARIISALLQLYLIDLFPQESPHHQHKAPSERTAHSRPPFRRLRRASQSMPTRSADRALRRRASLRHIETACRRSHWSSCADASHSTVVAAACSLLAASRRRSWRMSSPTTDRMASSQAFGTP